ncbi:MAG TPA: ATP-binding protein [Terriglobales bacterium]|nr:ATP-binding protein [Terriglobales bacterium]
MRFLRSTRARLVLVQVGVLAVAVAVAVAAVFELATVPARNQEDQALFDQWSAVANALDLRDGQVVYPPGQLPDLAGASRQPVEVDVYTGSGLLIQTPAQSLSPTYLAEVAGRVLGGSSVGPIDIGDATGGDRRLYAALQPVGDQRAAIVVSLSSADLQTFTQRLLGALVVGGGLLVAIGGGLAWVLVTHALRPVRVSFETLRRFTADASHELRAPLALMRTEVDVALARDRPAAEYRAVLARVGGEVEHLGRVVDQLLLLAQADAGRLVPSPAAVDVADLVEETAARWRAAAAVRGVTIAVDAPASGTLAADPHLLRRVLDNLLDNALRHGPVGSSVVLSARRHEREWQFDVADRGPGVPPAQRDRIFQRFARLDPARSRDAGGAGLGLALSAAVARAHGGSIELVDGDGGGARFRLRLPVQ